MSTALKKLGFNTQHVRETFKSNAFEYWAEAMRAKYEGKGRAYGRAEWEKLLGGFDVRLSSYISSCFINFMMS